MKSGFPLLLSLCFLGSCTCGCKHSGPPVESEPVTSSETVHEGWWCAEHGVPEGVCAQCNTQVAADFKAKGDWCQEHGRPESQCFVCHPELEAKFAAQYEAKYGKKPPKPTL